MSGPLGNGGGSRCRRQTLYLAERFANGLGWIQCAVYSTEPPTTAQVLALALLDREGVSKPTTNEMSITEIGKAYEGPWIVWPAEMKDLLSQVEKALGAEWATDQLVFPAPPEDDDLGALRAIMVRGALAAVSRALARGQVPDSLRQVVVIGDGADGREIARLRLTVDDFVVAARNARLLVLPPTPRAPKSAARAPSGWSKLYRKMAKMEVSADQAGG